jgi:REP element-mobilizing transposase RayT
MGRKPRISYPGAYFHVHTRGNNKGAAFVDTGDRLTFLRLLDRTTLKYGWIVYTWCLMTSHYHLVIRVPEDGLSAGMAELNGGYARWANFRHGRCDHVFGRRFISHEITTDAHLFAACRYVVLNPVRAGICSHPVEWRWSSYRALAGLERPQPFLALTELHQRLRDVAPLGIGDFDRYAKWVELGLVEFEHPVPGTEGCS